MGKFFLIGTGGFIGACRRYMVLSQVPRIKNIPAGTLTVNLLGTIVLAPLIFSFEPKSMVYFVNIGILGSFTTFSTFAYETFKLLEEGQNLSFFLNIFLNVALCLAGVSIAYLALGL
ncbi:fluoride efflux transporter FluC [Methanosarcina sp. UBA5]|uniref:fluoride efflux transporter FluC n=1 Tax=Methanosarcina sp. UBA5 TaxID=1915593 RepID=UPI0025D4E485|nr:CrcB family protein [Methanosarcina sp. UBA5]